MGPNKRLHTQRKNYELANEKQVEIVADVAVAGVFEVAAVVEVAVLVVVAVLRRIAVVLVEVVRLANLF